MLDLEAGNCTHNPRTVCWGYWWRGRGQGHPTTGGGQSNKLWLRPTWAHNSCISWHKSNITNLQMIFTLWLRHLFLKSFQLVEELSNSQFESLEGSGVQMISKWCDASHKVMLLKCMYYESDWPVTSQRLHKNTKDLINTNDGAARPSNGVDLMMPCRWRGGWPCTYFFRGRSWTVFIDS